MSSRWPVSLLNVTNRRLTDQVEQLTADIESKRNTLAEQREAEKLLKKHLLLTQREVTSATEALERERRSAQNVEGEAKQLQQELDADARRVRKTKEEEAKLTVSLQALETTIAQRRELFAHQHEISETLEEEVKEVVSAHLSRQRKGDDLAAAQRELSSSVWAKLDHLNKLVCASAQRLTDARNERNRAIQEANAMQKTLQDAVTDQAESVRTLELVHVQISQMDAQVRANAQMMEVLTKKSSEKKQEQSALSLELDKVCAERKQRASLRDRKRVEYNEWTRLLRESATSARDEESKLRRTASGEQAELQQLHHQLRELDHVTVLLEEKAQLLTQQQARCSALKQAQTQLRMEETSGKPSLAALRDIILSLSRQDELLEERLERTQAKLTAAVRCFYDEGQKGEKVNDRVGDVLKSKQALLRDQEGFENHVQLLKQKKEKLEDVLEERQALLSPMQALASEQRAKQESARLEEIEQLRTTLLRLQRDYQQLLHSSTGLRSGIQLARKTMEEKNSQQASVLETLRLLDEEVCRLERETEATAEERRNRVLQLEQATVALQSLMRAADAQVGMLKESAGVETYLRAEVQIEEERIRADMQGAALELHLHEGELHELNEELQRTRKKLNLLRQRYEEVMISITRAAHNPLNKEHNDSSAVPDMLQKSSSVDTEPEALHAHLLLRRSYEREQLMNRGNYLDIRLVSLERETNTLRQMLEGLRSSSSSSSNAVVGAEKAAGSCNGVKKGGVSTDGQQRAAKPDSNSRAPSGAEEQLLKNAVANEHHWRVELHLLDDTLVAMSQQRDGARVRMQELRGKLKELQKIKQQKRMQVQKLRDDLQSFRKKRTAASILRRK